LGGGAGGGKRVAKETPHPFSVFSTEKKSVGGRKKGSAPGDDEQVVGKRGPPNRVTSWAS